MGTHIIGLASAGLTGVFLLEFTRALPPSATSFCLAAIIFFAACTAGLVRRSIWLSKAAARRPGEDILFALYLADRSWSRNRLAFMTRVAAGFSAAIWLCA